MASTAKPREFLEKFRARSHRVVKTLSGEKKPPHEQENSITSIFTDADYSMIWLHSLLVDTQNVSFFFSSVTSNAAVNECM